MVNLLAIGIGAGLVSALLFGVVITASPLAMLLALISPLPIFIAALGWNHRLGLLAAVTGGIAMALALNVVAGVTFAVGLAIPSWWLAYLSLLGRPLQDGKTEWYPLGRVLLWIAGTATLITFLGVIAMGDGSYETYRASAEASFESLMRTQPAAPEAARPSGLAGIVIAALPFLSAFNFALMLLLNLWLAAKTVQISQRLPRPWPYIPATTMPISAVAVLAFAVMASFLPGFAGVFGLALLGALLSAFALQGLAFIHETSQRKPGRAFLLGSVYAFALVVSSIVMPLLALLGLADVAFSLRKRAGSGGAGPQLPTQ